MRELPYGESGLLIECDSSEQVTALYRALRSAVRTGALTGVAELVPAARTVLVEGGSVSRERVVAVLRELAPEAEAEAEGPRGVAGPDAGGRGAEGARGAEGSRGAELVIPMRYDGADLALVADTASLSVPEVVELHSSARYTVAFCGFAPGFGYLIGLPEPLRQARLDSPRPRVPAGSVGVAGEFCGVYPRSSPGGWRLIGHTGQTMFDPNAEPPSRLAPGDRVRFEPIRS